MSSAPEVRRPSPDEYADYYGGYIREVPEGRILDILKEQGAFTAALLKSLPLEKHAFRYAPGKWSIKEVLGHLVDTEWVFTYRALRFARGDRTPLPGVDQDLLMAGAGFDGRSLDSMLQENRHLRSAGLALFESFDEQTLDRRGVASKCPFTVRALLYVIAGHERHHVNVLRERYLQI